MPSRCIAISSWGDINVTCPFDILFLCMCQSCFALLAMASHRELMLSCFATTTVLCISAFQVLPTSLHSWPTYFFPKDVFFHVFQMKTTAQELPVLFIKINHPRCLLYHPSLSSVNFTSNDSTLSRLHIRMLYSIWSRTDCTGTSSIVWWFIITFFEICQLNKI